MCPKIHKRKHVLCKTTIITRNKNVCSENYNGTCVSCEIVNNIFKCTGIFIPFYNIQANKIIATLSRNFFPQKKPRISSKLLLSGWKTGLEPATLGTTNRCSNQLSYNHHLLSGGKYTT